MTKVTSSILNKMQKYRQKGASITELAKKFHIAKATASRYVGSYPILPEFIHILKEKQGGSKAKMIAKEKAALHEAESSIRNLTDKEKLLFLAALYWAEGSKKDFGLSNTDALLIRTFTSGLREILHVSDERICVSIRIYEDLDKETCLQFWSEIVKIPKEKFVNVNILKGKKVGKLKYGMCRVRVSKGETLLKKLKAIYLITGQKMSL